MRLLAGIAASGGLEPLGELDHLLSLRDQELVLVHVIDNSARGEMDLARGRLLPRPLPPHRLREIGQAERQAADATLREAAAAASALGARPETVVAEGEPGRVISELAARRGCELVAVTAREDRGVERPGPRSLGHTARFVTDHSPCPVLLVRGGSPPRPASRSSAP
jgi:nucleotide-binding universal stress UspA family protein